MKKKYVLMGAIAAALTSASVVYADDAQTQMNDQMGQTQTAPAMPTITTNNQNANQPSQMNTMGGNAQTGSGDMNMPPSPPPPSNNSGN